MPAAAPRARNRINRILFPLPEDQARQGFEPNLYIRSLRRIAGGLIALFRLNGVNRFSNEFIQLLDPRCTVPMPNGETLTFRTGHGRLLWRARTFQAEEPILIEWIRTFTPEDCFYDIGANVGGYTVYAAKLGIRVCAFEPELNNLQLLYENIFLNRVEDRCIPVPVGLSDATRLDTLFLKSVSKGDALHGVGRQSHLLRHPSGPLRTIQILTARLDDAIEIFRLPLPTRLKIDVDGNELRVLRGAERTLDRVSEVYVEIDHDQDESREVVRLLEDKGFRVSRTMPNGGAWCPNQANYLWTRQGGSTE